MRFCAMALLAMPVVLFVACGDSSEDSGPASSSGGTAGTAGAAGSSGTAGAAGMAGGAGSGIGGAAGTAGSSGADDGGVPEEGGGSDATTWDAGDYCSALQACCDKIQDEIMRKSCSQNVKGYQPACQLALDAYNCKG